jgi:hypothetical protein
MPQFRRILFKLVYIDMTKRPCINIRIVTEIMAREKYGLNADPQTLPLLHDYLSFIHYVYVNYTLFNELFH